ncbi:c-type cytochrome [Dissulfurirhabdus thermomarina]|nr:cytochrome c [Dissulfurirhabdus thermomarina]
MRKSLILAVLGVMLTAAGAMAGPADLFVKTCGQCHVKGGQAPPVNPADKAMSVWEKYFRRGRHPVDLSGKISSDQLQIVVEYLKDHAADSDQPLAAVIPK